MLISDEVWNALCKNARETLEPLLGRRFKSLKTGFVGVAYMYSLSGQLFLKDENGEHASAWADECEEVG